LPKTPAGDNINHTFFPPPPPPRSLLCKNAQFPDLTLQRKLVFNNAHDPWLHLLLL